MEIGRDVMNDIADVSCSSSRLFAKLEILTQDHAGV